MEKSTITCPQCGRRLAVLSGEIRAYRRITPDAGVSVWVHNNALGEALGWLRCPQCEVDQRFDASHWIVARKRSPKR